VTAIAIAPKKMIHFRILFPPDPRGYMRLFEKHTAKARTNRKVLAECRGWRAGGTSLRVHLDYSPGVVQHADNCAL